jgi:hypothetical protein
VLFCLGSKLADHGVQGCVIQYQPCILAWPAKAAVLVDAYRLTLSLQSVQAII